ncbi:MAG: DUF362 domain-containing protein [Desulfohalobiaceae bacterium]
MKDLNSKLPRREFLSLQLKGGLCLLGGLGLIQLPARALAREHPDLVEVQGSPDKATKAAVQALGGMSRFVKKGQKVVIKPNMSFDQPPEMATTTHPQVVQTLAQMCRDAGASRVSVLDNPLRTAELCLVKSGIQEAAEAVDVCQVKGVQAQGDFQETRIPDGKQLSSRQVMREVLQADVLISAPVAKHHSSTGVSLSMKGMMGLIRDRSEMHWRYDLHESIVDLCTLLKPDLVLVDATRALTSDGPAGPGEVVKPEKIIASTDMVAADAYTVDLIKWYGRSLDPGQVKHIRLAQERGLGNMDLQSLQVEKLQA